MSDISEIRRNQIRDTVADVCGGDYNEADRLISLLYDAGLDFCRRFDIVGPDPFVLIEWDRKREVWTVDGRDYKTLLEAENAITRPEGVTE